jgi:KDO2-lipid IV(A) lauroyltransferase
MSLSYFAIRILTFPISFLPFKAIHFMGETLGTLAYYLLPEYRKRTLSNLSLAKIDHLKPVAKASFQNLAITLLEYPKFARLKKIDHVLTCENPKEAKDLIDQGRGIIFFCGHQANWELLFLEGTSRMPGTAIGRPLKNKALYNWVVSIREKFGGKIITPRQTIKEGLRALKQGKFLGIVGDQALPESDYALDFFGRRAFTTPAPAILSYRTGCPIIVATIKRIQGKYRIHYSPPIWPRLKSPMQEEIDRMMKEALFILEEDIRKRPGQWLWQHNRWKQETPDNVYYRYRWDSILIILPKNFAPSSLETFRTIYPKAFLTIFAPLGYSTALSDVEIKYYEKEDDLFITDYRFKLVFNFTENQKLKKHFLRQSALHVLTLDDLKNGVAKEHLLPGDDFSMLLKKALTRPNTLWKKDAP